jgi:tetratricopeptide (TPR) repeat protein
MPFLNPIKITRIVADAYFDAAQGSTDMRAATEALERIRLAMLGENGLFGAWDEVDAQVGGAEPDRLQLVLDRLRSEFMRAAVEQETANLLQSFKRDPQEGWTGWISSYSHALAENRLTHCLALCDASLPFPPDADPPLQDIRKWTQRASHCRWPEAYQLYAKLADRDFLKPGVRAKLLFTAGRIWLFHFLQPEQARKQFERAEQIAPGEHLVACGLGDYWKKRSDLERAKECYERAISLAPSHPDGYVGLGECHEITGDLVAAEVQYQKAIKHGRAWTTGYDALLELHRQPSIFATRNSNISILVRYIVALEPSAEYAADIKAGSVYEQNDQFETAHHWYQKAIACDPSCIDGYISEGYLFLNRGDLKRAEENFSQAIAVAPEAMDGYWGMASLNEVQKDWAAAANWCEQSLQRRPQWELAIKVRIARLRLRLRQFEQAAATLTQALLMESDNAGAIDALSELAVENIDTALRIWAEIRHTRGESFEAAYQNGIANLRYSRGDYADASEGYRKAISADGGNAVYHANLAYALLQLRTEGRRSMNLEEASLAMRRAQELSPDAREYPAALAEIERLRKFVVRYGESAERLTPAVVPIQAFVQADLLPFILNETLDNLSAATIQGINLLRETIEKNWGLLIPGVSFVKFEDKSAPPGAYYFSLMEEPQPVALGCVLLGRRFVTGPVEKLTALGIQTEPQFVPNVGAASGPEGCWISELDSAKAAGMGLRIWEIQDYLLRHLQSALELNLAEFINYQRTIDLLNLSDTESRRKVRASTRLTAVLTKLLKRSLGSGTSILAFDRILKDFINSNEIAGDMPQDETSQPKSAQNLDPSKSATSSLTLFLGNSSAPMRSALAQTLNGMQESIFNELGIIFPLIEIQISEDPLDDSFQLEVNRRKLPPIAIPSSDEFWVNCESSKAKELGLQARPAADSLTSNGASIVRGGENVRAKCEELGYHALDPISYIANVVAAAIRAKASLLVSRDLAENYLTLLEGVCPDLVEATRRHIGLENLTQELRSALDQQLSIKDMPRILDSLLIAGLTRSSASESRLSANEVAPA